MRFLNPKTDYAFKKIFGSDQSGDILLSFLNSVLELRSPYRIASVAIVDPYLAPRIEGMKESFVDVRAVDERGKHYVIEMQMLGYVGFEQRILYNACKQYAGQIARGDDYRLLTDVIALTITDFVMFDDLLGPIHKFKLRADNGRIYSDDLEMVFVELPKFMRNEAELADTQDKWLYFLQYAPRLDTVPAIFEDEAPICHAFEIANRAALSPEEALAQEKREEFLVIQRGMMEKATLEGTARGMEQGMQQGMQQGLEQGLEQGLGQGMQQGLEQGRAEGARHKALDIARLLLPVLDDSAISHATGLTTQEVADLRQR